YIYHHPRDLHSFPTRRSSDLCMLDADMTIDELCRESIEHGYCSIKNYIDSSENSLITPDKIIEMIQNDEIKCQQDCKDFLTLYQDRKSTRLNSSHVSISYAVF